MPGINTGLANPNFNDGFADTALVDAYSIDDNAYPIYNMSGNGWRIGTNETIMKIRLILTQ